jgi:replication initiation protein RepC
MHQQPTTDFSRARSTHGGRVTSDALRYASRLSDDFAGLEEGADRYELLLLVKQAGAEFDFTPRMVQLLDYYVAYTTDQDWRAGSRPVVFQSVSRTALDLGVSERQVQKLEAALFAVGAITWSDCGNHRRYGQRCRETGRLLYAFGVDLSPLAALRERLQAALDAKRARDERWLGLKRDISAKRREFRGLAAEWQEQGGDPSGFVARYEAMATQIRLHLTVERLETLLAAHQCLVSELIVAMGIDGCGVGERIQRPTWPRETRSCSSTSEPEFAHYNYTNQPTKVPCSPPGEGFQESVAAGLADKRQASVPVASTAMEHVTLGMALGAASERFAAILPTDPGWQDVVEAAYTVRRELGISQASWAEACRVLGRSSAAVCLLVADRAALREADPVRTPPAYFRGMVQRAERGELRLCRSLFGLLKRDAAKPGGRR